VLIRGVTVDKYTYDLIDWLRQKAVVVACVVTGADDVTAGSTLHPPRHLGERAGALLARWLLQAIARIEALFLRAYPVHREHFRTYDLGDIARRADARSGSCDGDRDVDIVVDCTGDNSRSDRAIHGRFHLVSLEYGDPGPDRRGPPGFWECYSGRDGTAFAIRMRAPCGDVSIVRSGRVTTQFFFSLNQAHLFAKSHAQLKSILGTLIAGRSFDPASCPQPAIADGACRAPFLHHLLLYLIKLGYRGPIKVIRQLAWVKASWNIGIVHHHWDTAPYWKSISVCNRQSTFLADPFLCRRDNSLVCFAENYRFTEGRGQIACGTIGDGKSTFEPVLTEPFHLSFPFLFEYEGELYMCPECEQAKEIRVYRCVSFPYKWRLERVIMHNVSAVDTMLFQKDGRWWMLTNLDDAGIGDYCSELYLFHAKSPLAGEWTPHPQNPIKVDCLGGRNAGLLIEADRICRVGQCQGFDQYGKGLYIFEIESLNEEIYREKLLWVLEPDFKRRMLGIHHLSCLDDITVFDSATWKFVGFNRIRSGRGRQF
jgi:hypothetical protein